MNTFFRFLADFYSDFLERRRVIKRFNEASKEAYYSGRTDRMAKAYTTIGNSVFRHSMSRMRSGFCIELLGIDTVTKSEASQVAQVLLENGPFMRQLMAIGYDTLEIETGQMLYNWCMSDYHDLQKFALTDG